MSKRYGRNQKRRHRAEIARLSATNEALFNRLNMEAGLSSRLARELDQARETIRNMVEAIEAVCPHSVALPPKEVVGRYGNRDYFQVEFRESYDSTPIDEIVPDRLTFRMVDVYRLEAYLRENAVDFTAAVHLVYKDAAGRFPPTYMLSRQALERMPEERIMRQLLPDIGRRLLAMLRGR